MSNVSTINGQQLMADTGGILAYHTVLFSIFKDILILLTEALHTY